MWNLFEDRTLSLLERWKKFVQEHPEKENMAIQGFLQEVSDEFTQAMLKEK